MIKDIFKNTIGELYVGLRTCVHREDYWTKPQSWSQRLLYKLLGW